MKDLKEILKNTRKHLMTGVSYMIPFVVAGGILLALSVLLQGKAGVPTNKYLKDLFDIGVAGFTLMIPILAGFIGFSIAERSGIAPAAIGGYIGSQMGAGFIGALIAGLVGGTVVFYLKKIKVPKSMRSLMPIFVIPIIGTILTAGLIKWGLGGPIAGLTSALTAWLNGMSSGNIVILAIIIGLMEAFDMGGPVNKVAYAFVIMTVSQGVYTIAGISAVGVCVPPIAMGIASKLAPKKYTEEEREAGVAAILMGCIGITEGAIPFAAGDPIRVIPSIMVGSAVGSAISALFGVKCMVAWGGLIVAPAVTGIVGFLIAVVVGSVTGALLVNIFKKPVSERIDKSGSGSIDDIEISIQ